MSKRLIYIAGIVGLIVACGAFFAVVLQDAYNTTLPIADAGDAFMMAWQDQRLEAAYELISPQLQNRLSYDAFQANFAGASISNWSFNSRSIWNEIGEVAGTATINDENFDLQLEFIDNGAGWQLVAYDFAPIN